MPQNAREVVGKAAIRAMYQEVFDAYAIEGGRMCLETGVAGNWVFFRSTYTLRATPTGRGKSRGSSSTKTARSSNEYRGDGES